MTLTGLKEKLTQTELFSRTILVEEVMDGVLDIRTPSLKDFPIHVTIDGDMMDCWVSIAHVSEIPEDKVHILNEALLRGNGLADLSNFAIVGDNYCLKGDLSSKSTFENIVLELETLIDTTEDAIEEVFLPILHG
jgi:uncharacterized protein YjfI (DUF2170 family)